VIASHLAGRWLMRFCHTSSFIQRLFYELSILFTVSWGFKFHMLVRKLGNLSVDRSIVSMPDMAYLT
jgi:hypothetical protein